MNWEDYWTSYPKRFGETEYLKQIKNTVGGKPVHVSKIHESVATICSRLELKQNDVLLDLCCGNGLISKELAKTCHSLVGIDFSKTLIEIAKRNHGAENISYFQMNVLDLPNLHQTTPKKFNKIVMSASLQYFKIEKLPALLRGISLLLSESGIVLLTAIPDRKCKATFYNTTRRRLRHLWEQMSGRDQMGTWWDAAAIEKVCLEYNFDCNIYRSTGQVGSDYRFDIKITRKKLLDQPISMPSSDH